MFHLSLPTGVKHLQPKAKSLKIVPRGTLIAQKRYSSKKIVVDVPRGTGRGLIFTKKEVKITGMFHMEHKKV